jgi:shikimate 5-dehydrogenase
MIFALVGHRGVGKTSLLKRIKTRDHNTRIVDLDQMIAAYEGLPVEAIFKVKGEAHFRALETKMLANMVSVARQQLGDVWVAVGAGFRGPMPPDVHVVWVRRRSDQTGRIFLDRPRLEPALRPLDEYALRFSERETRFSQWADDCLELREGSHRLNDPSEDQFLHVRLNLAGATRCLLPRDFARPHLEQKLRGLVEQNIAHIELRDDLLSDEQMRWALLRCPSDRVLLSFRAGRASWVRHIKNHLVDLDCALLDEPHLQSVKAKIVSKHSHTSFAGLSAAELTQLESRAAQRGAKILKLAVPCGSFSELKDLHLWGFAKNSQLQRAALPMSTNGRWGWYRQYLKGRSPLSFVREFDSGVSDQPSLSEWSLAPTRPERFAAVLGDPVWHSQSPLEHAAFFGAQGAVPFWPVQISQGEFNLGALDFLKELGLVAAAVTAPLKTLVFDLCRGSKKMSLHGSVNTLALTATELKFQNTDFIALKQIIEQDFFWTQANQGEGVVVWGQGAMAQQLALIWPRASVYASGQHSSESKLVSGPRPVNPSLVVWAASPTAPLPKADWGAPLIWDLNYVEHSAAREWAQQTGATYVSGEALFCRQAAAQQSFWTEELL